MTRTQAIDRRFAELGQEVENLEIKSRENDYVQVDSKAFVNWKTKASHLILLTCGEHSQHLKRFLEAEKDNPRQNDFERLKTTSAIFLAAKDDYENGMLTSLRNLIQAEVFTNELDQAEELDKAGYHIAAAVTAGVVLETTIRKLCEDNDIGPSKLDKMNADLAKAGVYNALVQKQVTAWAHVRNKAAHGQSGQFTKEDVTAMIADVGRFVAERLS